jgi:hypothetical protein
MAERREANPFAFSDDEWNRLPPKERAVLGFLAGVLESQNDLAYRLGQLQRIVVNNELITQEALDESMTLRRMEKQLEPTLRSDQTDQLATIIRQAFLPS